MPRPNLLPAPLASLLRASCAPLTDGRWFPTYDEATSLAGATRDEPEGLGAALALSMALTQLQEAPISLWPLLLEKGAVARDRMWQVTTLRRLENYVVLMVDALVLSGLAPPVEWVAETLAALPLSTRDSLWITVVNALPREARETLGAKCLPTATPYNKVFWLLSMWCAGDPSLRPQRLKEAVALARPQRSGLLPWFQYAARFVSLGTLRALHAALSEAGLESPAPLSDGPDDELMGHLELDRVLDPLVRSESDAASPEALARAERLQPPSLRLRRLAWLSRRNGPTPSPTLLAAARRALAPPQYPTDHELGQLALAVGDFAEPARSQLAGVLFELPVLSRWQEKYGLGAAWGSLLRLLPRELHDEQLARLSRWSPEDSQVAYKVLPACLALSRGLPQKSVRPLTNALARLASHDRGNTAVAMLKALPGADAELLVNSIVNVYPEPDRTSLLRAALPYVPQPLVPRLREAIEALVDPEGRTFALLALRGRTAPGELDALWTQLLASARKTVLGASGDVTADDEASLARVLEPILAQVPESRFDEAAALVALLTVPAQQNKVRPHLQRRGREHLLPPRAPRDNYDYDDAAELEAAAPAPEENEPRAWLTAQEAPGEAVDSELAFATALAAARPEAAHAYPNIWPLAQWIDAHLGRVSEAAYERLLGVLPELLREAQLPGATLDRLVRDAPLPWLERHFDALSATVVSARFPGVLCSLVERAPEGERARVVEALVSVWGKALEDQPRLTEPPCDPVLEHGTPEQCVRLLRGLAGSAAGHRFVAPVLAQLLARRPDVEPRALWAALLGALASLPLLRALPVLADAQALREKLFAPEVRAAHAQVVAELLGALS